MKKCSKCLAFKSFSDFHKNAAKLDKLQDMCKLCTREYQKCYYVKNKKIMSDKCKIYYLINKQKILSNVKSYNLTNKDKINKYKAEYIKHKRSTDIYFKLVDNIRCRLYKAIKQSKQGSAIKDLGCTVKELKLHLESKFQDGMTWQNHGEWHIDHIKPLSSFNLEDREEFLKACHYTNLQPLWAKDNLIKGGQRKSTSKISVFLFQ